MRYLTIALTKGRLAEKTLDMLDDDDDVQDVYHNWDE